MNRYTEQAYNFFANDKDAKIVLKYLISTTPQSPELAKKLYNYANGLSRMEWLAIWRDIFINVIEAVDWKEVAYMLMADEFNVPPVATDSIPEYDERFDSNDQGD